MKKSFAALILIAILCDGGGISQTASRPCRRRETQHATRRWPTLGTPTRPHRIDTTRLPRAVGLDARYYGADAMDFVLSNACVVSYDYHYLGGVGHARTTLTRVYYLPREHIFYLMGDCMMGHFDEWTGPFRGDPRVVLRRAARAVTVVGRNSL